MGEKEGAPPTLEDLARRLEALERENERMRSENAELRREVATLRDSDTPRHELAELRGSGTRRDVDRALEFEGPVSRRQLLRNAATAAVGAVTAGTLLNPREAQADHFFGNGIEVDSVSVHSDIRIAVHAASEGTSAVLGENNSATESSVHGINRGGGPAVRGGSTPNGIGVLGEGRFGVYGRSNFLNNTAVVGEHTGTGYGVAGLGRGNNTAGVLGRHLGPGANAGYAGRFEGGKAQLMILPKPTAGRPRTGAHAKGELYMDSTATLFVCVASGTPGRWRRVQTVAS